MDLISSVVTVVVAYFVGSFPAGYLVAKLKGVDIRQEGSGNIGATNAFRVLGKPAGAFVLFIDALKGWLAVVAVTQLVFRVFDMEPEPLVREMYEILAAFAVVLGHNYTCWLGFKGGKGIATSAGLLLALVPWTLAIIMTVFVVLFLLTRYVSVGSIAASIALPISTICLGRSPMIIGLATAMGLLAVFRHRSNIRRLLNGTESRVEFGKKKTSE